MSELSPGMRLVEFLRDLVTEEARHQARVLELVQKARSAAVDALAIEQRAIAAKKGER